MQGRNCARVSGTAGKLTAVVSQVAPAALKETSSCWVHVQFAMPLPLV